ncbi:hypothetical protein, partial [Lysobacter sp. F60174L2]|uniref:hypothetical protein n=1 Tax=Lysobacter sp. F60174L2 TaxID=3459295 RepID=UPI00403D6EB9
MDGPRPASGQDVLMKGWSNSPAGRLLRDNNPTKLSLQVPALNPIPAEPQKSHLCAPATR